jgi:hypothetical protein
VFFSPERPDFNFNSIHIISTYRIEIHFPLLRKEFNEGKMRCIDRVFSIKIKYYRINSYFTRVLYIYIINRDNNVI